MGSTETLSMSESPEFKFEYERYERNPSYLRPAERGFEKNFFEGDSLRKRMFNICQENSLKGLFKNGFELWSEMEDDECIPKFYTDYNDLYKRFYMNLCKKEIIDAYITDLETFFKPNGKPNMGCIMETESGMFPKTYPIFEELDETYVSSKVIEKSTCFKARKTINKDEFIIKEHASILCKSPSCVCSKYYYYECLHCTRGSSNFYVCHDCNVAIYCSDECRTTAFEEYHRYECRAAKCHFFGKTNSLWVAFRMLMIGTLNKFDESADNKYQYISKIAENKCDEELLDALRGTTCILLYLRMYTDYFTSETMEELYPKLSVQERLLVIGGILLGHVITAPNATFYFPDETFSLNAHTGAMNFATPALCVKASKLEHACSPNAAMIMKNNYYCIKSLTTILPGSKITLNFQHLDVPFYGSDRKFECKCNSCQENRQHSLQAYICYNCKGNTLQKWHGDNDLYWVCNACHLCEENEDMDVKVDMLNSYFARLKEAVEGYKECVRTYNDFMLMYADVHVNYYPKYLYAIHKMLQRAITNLDPTQAEHCSAKIYKEAPNILGQHSFQLIDLYATIVNFVLTTIFKRGVRFDRLLDIGNAAVKLMKPLCKFHMLESQYDEFLQVFNNAYLNFKTRTALSFDYVDVSENDGMMPEEWKND